MTLTQKDLKNLVNVASLAGRLRELERVSPYVPSHLINKRKTEIRKKLNSLITGESEKEEVQDKIHIKIELPETELKRERKSLYKFNLRDLFSGKKSPDFNDDNDYDDDRVITRVVRGFFPEEEIGAIGKIITEL